MFMFIFVYLRLRSDGCLRLLTWVSSRLGSGKKKCGLSVSTHTLAQGWHGIDELRFRV